MIRSGVVRDKPVHMDSGSGGLNTAATPLPTFIPISPVDR
jgi:hypothetical protein